MAHGVYTVYVFQTWFWYLKPFLPCDAMLPRY